MAIARALYWPSRPVLSRSLAALRCASTSTRPPQTPKSGSASSAPKKTPRSPNSSRPNPKKAPLHATAAARKFISPDGKLRTTASNWAWFQEKGIGWDNSATQAVRMGPEHGRIATDYTVRVSYSPLQIIHPYHLAFLNPRGHAYMDKIKDMYEQKQKTSSLWIYASSKNKQTAIVRSIGQRRFKAALYEALEALGYPDKVPVVGTVFITIHDTAKAVNFPVMRFAEATAPGVIEAWRRCEAQGRLHHQQVAKLAREDEGAAATATRKSREGSRQPPRSKEGTGDGRLKNKDALYPRGRRGGSDTDNGRW